MIIEGYGDDSYDYQLAFQLFTEASVLNEPRGFNGLGYMYLHGLGVRKNVRKGMNYFKSKIYLINIFYNRSSRHEPNRRTLQLWDLIFNALFVRTGT